MQLSLEALSIATEQSSPDNGYEFSVSQLVSILPPANDDYAHFKIDQALDRLRATGNSPAQVALRLQQETMIVGINQQHIGQLMGEKPEYFDTLTDQEKRLFLFAGTLADLYRLEVLKTAVCHGLILLDDLGLHTFHDQYEGTMEYMNSIYKPKSQNEYVMNGGDLK